MRLRVSTIAPDVHFAETRHVNWAILTGQDGVVLIDSGYPRQTDLLRLSLNAVGRSPDDVVAGIATHGHSDHIGGFAALQRMGHKFPVYAHALEVPNLTRTAIHQVNARRVGPDLLRPRVALWAVAAYGLGGLEDVRLRYVRPVESDPGLGLPYELNFLHTPGHTPGHLAVHLPKINALIAGDAVATSHPTRSARGLALLPSYFNCDTPTARDTAVHVLQRVATVLPGHGPRVHLDAPFDAAHTPLNEVACPACLREAARAA